MLHKATFEKVKKIVAEGLIKKIHDTPGPEYMNFIMPNYIAILRFL